MPLSRLPEPWPRFLREIDSAAGGEIALHCLGGFALTAVYGSTRSTKDLDFIAVVPHDEGRALVEIGGIGTELHRKYGTYLDFVTVATVPEDYGRRLRAVPSSEFSRLRLYALDPYDLALAKLERNLERDREDVKFLARAVPLELEVLKDRYERELRPYLAIPAREDLTLRLWVEMIEEERLRTAELNRRPTRGNSGPLR